jgi:hypothetical protein
VLAPKLFLDNFPWYRDAPYRTGASSSTCLFLSAVLLTSEQFYHQGLRQAHEALRSEHTADRHSLDDSFCLGTRQPCASVTHNQQLPHSRDQNRFLARKTTARCLLGSGSQPRVNAPRDCASGTHPPHSACSSTKSGFQQVGPNNC